jgi:hypothetical protein
MAPQVYQWGMEQYGKNQGNIDELMRTADSYSSPQRQAVDMGQAEAGVMQANERGRQNAVRDLESYGIDPSSGRYADLDHSYQVQGAAAAAGAGNQQRMADEQTGMALKQQATSASMQNYGYGIASEGAANAYLGTGMKLGYSPLGSTSDSESTGQSTGQTQSQSQQESQGNTYSDSSKMHYATGGEVEEYGGYVPQGMSPSGGAQTDDVPAQINQGHGGQAQLNAGEFVIPRDVVEWKGQEFFHKLMEGARKTRMSAGSMGGGEGGQSFAYGGAI